MKRKAERWRQSVSAPTLLVSTHGRIMCLPYFDSKGRERGGVVWPGSWDKTTERYIVKVKDRTYKVARLVCEAFNGSPPFEDAVAMHRDENSSHNEYTNLKWGTQKDNLNFPGFIAYCRSRTGDDSPARKGAILA